MDTETDRGKAILITVPWTFFEPKTWEECVDFLSRFRQMACWNADYDGQAILKHLPAAVRNRIALLHEGQYRDYKIKYVKAKFFRVWREDKHLFTVYDMRQFYNCSLEVAAKKLNVQPKKSIPKSWYVKVRQVLNDPKTRERFLQYALGDAQTLQQIIDRTVEAFKVAGLKFERPFSNASFGERYFRSKFGYRRNEEVEKMARSAYHGGRIECLRAGYFKQAYLYDINSAYPSQIAKLIKPDGRWVKGKEVRGDAIYAFVDCMVRIPNNEAVGPIPVRRRSNLIIYPVGRFRKTITLPEFNYLESRGWIEKIYSAYCHVWPSYKKPFQEIEDLYVKRKKYPAQDYALKIVMNATYGKMAQVLENLIRVHYVNGKTMIFDGRVWRKKEEMKNHTSFVYAATITANIRMKLLDIPTDKVIFYSTDGVMTTEPVNLPLGKGLGEWGMKKVTDLIVVGSGVYVCTVDNRTVVRFRGFSPNIDLRGMLKRAGRRHFVNMKVLRNTSLRMAIDRPHTLNVLEPVTRVLNVNFDSKRFWSYQWNAGELTHQTFKSESLVYYKPIKLPLNT